MTRQEKERNATYEGFVNIESLQCVDNHLDWVHQVLDNRTIDRSEEVDRCWGRKNRDIPKSKVPHIY